ncbi:MULTISPECIES: dTDP-4-dehydrorhamnose 3,5-epimerase [unclassified Ensifer]|uniref:dTDP-4-dehydrorhamnose 3,5-epimerase n=1 Tax=unclassified Ensifer TaxID=2633371 RepID=UPI0008135730|nr:MULTISPECIES: dTDP-4-dehydrorhamnose 3,5-epimerase [unclassified Ensifer]OCP23024.1 dTDP-4-dehydrorhamnose 3,5-epimerase [Ensifer sp. LC384]OCP23659.1 dTDP-4-dehydrorhamnose 3,5-epimerase [Ensifer sp. LC54]
MSRFHRIATPITNLVIIERQRFGDERGFFSRFFCREELADFGANGTIAQINHTMTRMKGTIRGMHFQRAPHDEAKFVSCLAGSVFDVAVDLRPGSPTYLQWHGEVLSADNGRSMMIPGGFAHGFQTLTEGCELIYLHDKPYTPEAEGGLNALDPKLAIDWPLPVAQMSARDEAFPLL